MFTTSFFERTRSQSRLAVFFQMSLQFFSRNFHDITAIGTAYRITGAIGIVGLKIKRIKITLKQRELFTNIVVSDMEFGTAKVIDHTSRVRFAAGADLTYVTGGCCSGAPRDGWGVEAPLSKPDPCF